MMNKIFISIIQEAKEVNWPKRKQLLNLLLYVIVLSGVISLIILGLDVLFLNIRDQLLNL